MIPSAVQGITSILIMVPITTYYLNPEDFGVVAIIMALLAPLLPLTGSGSTWVLSGNYFKINSSEKKELIFNIAVMSIALKLFWIITFYLLSDWLLKNFINDFRPEFSRYFYIAVIASALNVFSPLVMQLLVLRKNANLYVVLSLLRYFIIIGTMSFCLIYLKMDVITLFIAPCIASLILFFIEIYLIFRNCRIKYNKRWITEVVKVGFPSIPSSLAETLSKISDRYFIERWLDFFQLGIYTHSQKYTDPIKKFRSAFSQTIASDSLKAFSDNDLELIQSLVKLVKQIFRLFFVGGVILILFSSEVVNILTHGKFIESAPLIPLAYCIIFCNLYGELYTQFLIAKKETYTLMKSMLFTSLIFIIITATSVFYFGIYGATLSIVTSNLCIHLWRAKHASRLGLKIQISAYFLVGFIIYFIIYLAFQLLPLPLLFKIVFCTFLLISYILVEKNQLLRIFSKA